MKPEDTDIPPASAAVAQDWSADMSAIASDRDQAAFARLYDYYLPRVTSYLKGLGMNAALAEETAQETLIRVWRKASQYDPDTAAVSTWMFRIARNLFIDNRRKHARQNAISLDNIHYEPEINEDTGSQIDGERARQLLEALPPIQAQVVYKSYFEGLSHSEIARDLELPLGTVKSNIRLAFTKLRAALPNPELAS